MKTLFKISLPALALFAWSCAPEQYASRTEFDDIYVSSKDIKEVGFEQLVSNNQAQNFNRLQQAPQINELENFSSKNVNPDFLARYSNDAMTAELTSDDYFVEDFNANQGQNGGLLGNTNYNNFAINNNQGFGGNPMFWDPFWDPMWGPGMSTWGMMNTFGPMGAWGFGTGWSTGMSIGVGFGNMGWNRMNRWNRFGWNRLTPAWFFGNPGMGMGMGMDPFFWDPWYNPGIAGFYSPWNMGRFGMWGNSMWGNPMWGGSMWGGSMWGGGGWNGPFINNGLVVVNNSERPMRNVVRGPRDGRSSMYAQNAAGSNGLVPATANTRSAVAAQSGRSAASRVANNATAGSTRAFNNSQNELYSASRRAAMSSRSSSYASSRSQSSLGTTTSQARRSYVIPNANTSNSRRSVNTSTYGRPMTNTQQNNATYNRTTSSPTRSSSSSMMRSSSSSSRGSIGTMSTGSSSSRSSSGGGGASRSSGGRGGR